MKKNNKLVAVIILITLMFNALAVYVPVSAEAYNANGAEILAETIDGIINWKKNDTGSLENGFLINENFLNLAGSTPGDWYPIGMGRYGYEDNYLGYLAVINDYVQTKYQTSNLLDRNKSTEWHRIALAVTAAGGDPRKMGTLQNIDLIADGTYNRIDTSGKGILGKQGINGFIWGLIALDSKMYPVPEGAYYTRDDIIVSILAKQLSDGGFSLMGTVSDVDITAMAVQALSTYYNSETKYTYNVKRDIDGTGLTDVSVTKTVRQVIDECIICLSSIQDSDGGYSSWGMANAESTVQAAVALCNLGINIFTDERFIKNGFTLFDGIMKYRTENGGFAHSYVSDAQNPSAHAGEANSMAGEQVLYGLVSIYRNINGMRKLYDFREEQDAKTKSAIEEVSRSIDNLCANNEASSKDITAVYENYTAIEAFEREYVYNYYKLSALMKDRGIPFCKEEDINIEPNEESTVMYEFTQVDIEKVSGLPQNITTEYYGTVVSLLYKLENSFDFGEKEQIKITLEKAKNEIILLQAEIDSINSDIEKTVYPYENIGISDKDSVKVLILRYEKLSDYDRTKIVKYDDVLKAMTKINNTVTEIIITVCSIVAAFAVTALAVINIKKRAAKKRKAKYISESDE